MCVKEVLSGMSINFRNDLSFESCCSFWEMRFNSFPWFVKDSLLLLSIITPRPLCAATTSQNYFSGGMVKKKHFYVFVMHFGLLFFFFCEFGDIWFTSVHSRRLLIPSCKISDRSLRFEWPDGWRCHKKIGRFEFEWTTGSHLCTKKVGPVLNHVVHHILREVNKI